MILGNLQSLFLLFSGLIFLFSLIYFLILFLIESKSLLNLFKRTPFWFFLINLVVLIYKLFFIPNIVFRESFGIWIIGMAKSHGLFEVLFTARSPVYFFIINFFSYTLDGISFVFVSHFNIILFFISVFYVYWIVDLLLKNKWVSFLSGSFYALAPPTFIHSLTEGYTNPALFFAIQALFFIVLYKEKKEISFFLMAATSSFLAVGSRPEYIIFDVIFLAFLYFFVEKIKLKHYLLYLIAFLPKFFIAINLYLSQVSSDKFLAGKTFVYNGDIVSYIIKLLNYRIYGFIDRMPDNLLALINPLSLMGLFLFFSLMFFFKWNKLSLIWKKTYLFFGFYFLAFFFYYSFLHMLGVSEGNYKYLASLVFPLTVMAAMGIFVLFSEKNKIYYYFLICFILFYSFWVCTPLTFDKNFFIWESVPKLDKKHFNGLMCPYLDFNKREQMDYKEWQRYNSLDFSELDSNKNNFFISNGARSFLYVLPLKDKIYPVFSIQELSQVLSGLKEGDNIYISQGVRGFWGKQDSSFRAVNSKNFENYIKNNLVIEEEFFSYYEEEHHVFLYKARKK